MNKLERAALSGDLTSISNINQRESHLYSDREDQDHDSHGLNPQATSQIMTRGWSGNTGPKGVLLDFKASHGKSGAILGGNALINPTASSMYTRQISMSSTGSNVASKRSLMMNSSPSSDSDSSNHSDQRNSNNISTNRINNDLYASTKTTTRLTQNPSNHPSPNTSSNFSTCTSFNLNQKNLQVNNPNGCKLFGHLREVGAENFIQSIEAEKHNNQTVVLVHLYDPAIESCVILNNHLSNLARAHPRTKFLRALASELDFFSTSGTMKGGKFTIPNMITRRPNGEINLMDHDPFDELDSTKNQGLEEEGIREATDSDILPTLIWYRAGQYVQSLPALESQMPRGGIIRGEKGCKDLEVLLKRNGVISTS